ncbi:HAD family hydrolase [Pontibacter sp. G13]|uniref:HAD family hydrolase n=1 Tax=Pontibacter sp. G13 TaxID=3074898 RepID=UPI00288BC67D|nr:HAD family hydrolase [Pontibacter sp. G13]WNJ19507.1 HAD family hydrolase [Pontibacter sp. G13]
MLIVLDLDETLIHATRKGVEFEIMPEFEVYEYKIYVRPFLLEFVTELSKEFEIGIWSSAHEAYIEAVLEKIIPEEIKLEFIWGSEKCTVRRDLELDRYVKTKRLKKLKKLGYSMNEIIMIDDSAEKLKQNYGNSIIIRPFMGNPLDKELSYLWKYLLSLKGKENVRVVEKDNWRNEIIK